MSRTLVKLEDILVVNPSSWSKKEGWTYLRYLDTANITNGRIDEIVTFNTKTDKIPSRARRIVQNGDFVYSTVRPNQKHYGLLKNIEDNLVVSTGFAVLRSKYPEQFDTRFIYLLVTQDFLTNYLHGIAENNTSAYPALRPQDITDLEFEIPPISDQKLVADFIENLDDKIELNQQMNQTLEEIAKAIFKSWFVDFDPVQAKAEGRPTDLPPEISDLFPSELVDSEIGEIPKGWELQPLSEQISVNPKYSLKKGTDAYFVEMKCLSESTSSVSEGYIRSFTSGSKFQRFDTLFARITPCLENGKTGLLLNKSASGVCWGSTEFIVLSPQDDQSPLFPYCWARSENLRTAAVSSMTGSSGRQRVPNNFFDSYLVASPDSLLHQTFRKIADPIIDRIHVCNEEITTLSELRDTLLPKLISGELRIPDAEKFLEEAGI